MSDGIVRGVDGKIIANKIGSERAAELARMRWAKPKGKTLGTLLEEAGYPDPEQAPSHLRLLADYAVSGKSGSVYALRTFLAMTGRGDNEPVEGAELRPGERCPYCGRMMLEDLLGEEVLARILEAVRIREQELAATAET